MACDSFVCVMDTLFTNKQSFYSICVCIPVPSAPRLAVIYISASFAAVAGWPLCFTAEHWAVSATSQRFCIYNFIISHLYGFTKSALNSTWAPAAYTLWNTCSTSSSSSPKLAGIPSLHTHTNVADRALCVSTHRVDGITSFLPQFFVNCSVQGCKMKNLAHC